MSVDIEAEFAAVRVIAKSGLSDVAAARVETALGAIHQKLTGKKRNGTHAPEPVIPFALRPIAEIVAEQREPNWLLHRVLEAEVLAVIAGARGTFKSFIGLDWCMRMAAAGHSGVILSGEGAGLDRRVAAWMLTHGQELELAKLPLVALERTVSLNISTELEKLKRSAFALRRSPQFFLIDTLSKFTSGLDENDNSEVAAFLSGLSTELRDVFKASVMLVAHSGHADAKRPRGASALMANPDCEYIVERPTATSMSVTVSRERFKDSPSMPALNYEARVVDLGRVDRYGEPVTSLALISTNAPMPASKTKGGGRNQELAVVALREWCRANPGAIVITSEEMRGLLAAQGLNDRRRRPEALDYLARIKAITPSVAGYTVDGEML